MNQKTFSFIAGVIFFMVAVLHALRIIYAWDAVIGGWPVPMWISWIATVVAIYLSYQGVSLGRYRSDL
jgi:hypothetical protein